MLSRRRLFTVAGLGLLAGCGPDRTPLPRRVREHGTVRLGISGEQPYSYLTSSGLATGESPEVARVVLAGMGTTVLEAVQRRFDELIDALLDGALDIVAAGMSITPDRCGRVLFSAPDFVASTALLVRQGNPLGLTDFADVARARVPVAVLDGSIEQDFARGAGVPAQRIHATSTQLDLYQAVFGDQVPVGALTDISLRSIVARERASGLQIVRVSGSGVGDRRGRTVGGFAFRPGDRQVRDEFSAGLKALHRSGQWLTIVRPFALTKANQPPAELTTAQLCAHR